MATTAGGTAVTLGSKKWQVWGLIEWNGETRKVHVEPGRRFKVIRTGVAATFDGVDVTDALEVQDLTTGKKIVVKLADMT